MIIKRPKNSEIEVGLRLLSSAEFKNVIKVLKYIYQDDYDWADGSGYVHTKDSMYTSHDISRARIDIIENLDNTERIEEDLYNPETS